MKPSAFIPLAVFGALLILLGVGLKLNPKEVPSPLIGKPAPIFTLSTVEDPEQKISHRDFLGKVSLLNVWASWCSACRDEHPLLVEFAKKHQTPIYGMNYKDQRNDAKRWLQHFGNPYIASAFDPRGKASVDWGVYGVPETFLIDKKGIVRYKQIGPLTQEALDVKILPLIRKLEAES